MDGEQNQNEKMGRFISKLRKEKGLSQEALAEQIKPDIVYGDGIGYPYTWSEVAVYLPRLCAKHMTPEELAWRIKYHNDTWNVTSPEIQTVRATEKKSKKIKKNRGESR